MKTKWKSVIYWFVLFTNAFASEDQQDVNLPAYLAAKVPGVAFTDANVERIVGELDRIAKANKLDELGYRGISVVNSKGHAAVTGTLTEGPFAGLIEFAAKQIGSYIIEEHGLVLLMPNEVLDPNMTSCICRLTERTARILNINRKSSQADILVQLAKAKLTLPHDSSAKITEDGAFLVLRTHRDSAEMAQSLFTLLERGLAVVPLSAPKAIK